MPKQAWSQGLAAQNASGTLFTTYTTAKTVINQQALYPVGANTLAVGDSFTVTVLGGLSNIATTPGTVTFQVMMGTIVMWTSGAIQMNATAHTTIPFRLVVELTVQLVNTTVGGAIAKMLGIGTLVGPMFTRTIAATDSWGRVSAADASVSDVTILVPITAPAQGTAFDSTITNNLDFWTGFSISNVGNGVQIHQYRVDGNN